MGFFRRSKPASPAEHSPRADDVADDVTVETDDELDVEMASSAEGDVYDASHEAREWRERADAVIPGGASTGSKRADALFGAPDDGDDDYPAIHYVRASGCELVTARYSVVWPSPAAARTRFQWCVRLLGV